MKVYIVKVESCHDFEEDSYTEGVYFSKEQAKRQFDQLVKEAKENAEEDTYVSVDCSHKYESFGSESTAKDHCYINLEEVEVTVGFSPKERMDTLAIARDAIEKELKNRALKEIEALLKKFKTNELDFSILVNTSEGEGCLQYDEAQENKILITQFDKYGSTWEVYPVGVKKVEGRLEFICLNDDDARNNCDLRSDWIDNNEMYRLASMLLYYLGAPEDNNIEIEHIDSITKVKINA